MFPFPDVVKASELKSCLLLSLIIYGVHYIIALKACHDASEAASQSYSMLLQLLTIIFFCSLDEAVHVSNQEKENCDICLNHLYSVLLVCQTFFISHHAHFCAPMPVEHYSVGVIVSTLYSISPVILPVILPGTYSMSHIFTCLCSQCFQEY